MLELNETAQDIVSRCDGRTVGEIIQTLAEEYDIDPQMLGVDVRETLADLQRRSPVEHSYDPFLQLGSATTPGVCAKMDNPPRCRGVERVLLPARRHSAVATARDSTWNDHPRHTHCSPRLLIGALCIARIAQTRHRQETIKSSRQMNGLA